MKRLLIVLAAATLLLPGAARAAACSPLDCAPSQFTFGHGTLLAYRQTALGQVHIADLRTGQKLFSVPGGFVGGNLLVHRAGQRLIWFDLRTGAARDSTSLPWPIRLAGVSQDGSRAVGFRLTPDGATTVVVASPAATRTIVIRGRQWDFDALHGARLYLIRYMPGGGYQVRLLDLRTSVLAPRPLKDPHESGTIWGSPFARLTSADGSMLFTLYLSSNGAAMVHELDLVHATARCIDLPGTGDYGAAASWAMALSPDARTLWAISPGYGRAVAIDVSTRKVRSAFRFDLPYWNIGGSTRVALARDGRVLAVGDGEEVVRLALAEGKVLQRSRTAAVALGWSPVGRLWTLR